MLRVLLSPFNAFVALAKTFHAAGDELVTFNNEFKAVLGDLDIPAQALTIDQHQQREMFAHCARVVSGLALPKTGADVVDDFIHHNLAGLVYRRLPDLASIVMALANTRLDAIVLHNDVEPGLRAAAMWGRENNVPVIHVPHSAYYQMVGRGKPGTDIHDIITATHLAAAGDRQIEWYTRRGFPPENIARTGLPQFDKWAELRPDRDRACRMLKLPSTRPVVVYGSSWRQNTNLLGNHDGVWETYLNFLEAAKALPEMQVIVKTHPNAGQGDVERHAEEARKHGLHCPVTGLHLEHVLQAADIVLAYGGSNMLLEAAYIPGIRLATIGGYENDPEVYKVAPTVEGIKTCLREALSTPPPSLGDFLFRYTGTPDGQAAGRVVAFIKEVVNARTATN